MTPELYDGWQVVDLTHLDSDHLIEIRSNEVPRIVFSTDMDFYTQLTRLDYLMDQVGPAYATIDLSLGQRVVVTYDEDAPRLSPAIQADARVTTRPDSRAPSFPPLPDSLRSPISAL